MKPLSPNKISYLNELSLFCQKKKINLFPNRIVELKIASQGEDILSLNEKKNYTEEDIFSFHKVDKFINKKRNYIYNPIDKRTNSNSDTNSYPNVPYIPESMIRTLNMNKNVIGESNETKEIILGLYPELNEQNLSHTSEKEEEIDRLIMQLSESADNKTKTQLVKKFISYYKKNKTDEAKLTSFYVKLSSQIQENPTDLHFWMDYEYLRSKIDSLQFGICKEVSKFLQICTNLKLNYNSKDFNDRSAKFSKQTIINKINEFLQCVKEEDVMFHNHPILTKLIEKYDPTKIKKKNCFFQDKLIKKIKEIFDKYHLPIKETAIYSLFFNINNNKPPVQNNISFTSLYEQNQIIGPTHMIEPISKMNTIEFIPSQMQNENEGTVGSINSLTPKDIMGLDKLISLPAKSMRFKIKQFSLEDFCNDPMILMNNQSSQY